MPKGVYKRTKQMRINISISRRGIVPWNKSISKYQNLLNWIRWLLTIDGPLTLSEIYSRVGGEVSYKSLWWLVSRARANGLLDKALIKENRGLMKNKGGGPPPKFQVGDKVRISPCNTRTPQWLLEELRADNPRTIISVFHQDNGRRGYLGCHYYLGTNTGGNILSRYPFRAEELVPYMKGKVGRPRTKRAYNQRHLEIMAGIGKA